jgi:hypothetical protein
MKRGIIFCALLILISNLVTGVSYADVTVVDNDIGIEQTDVFEASFNFVDEILLMETYKIECPLKYPIMDIHAEDIEVEMSIVFEGNNDFFGTELNEDLRDNQANYGYLLLGHDQYRQWLTSSESNLFTNQDIENQYLFIFCFDRARGPSRTSPGSELLASGIETNLLLDSYCRI